MPLLRLNGLCLHRFMKALSFLFSGCIIAALAALSGCANIIPPGGGPRDSLPPLLVSVTPPDSATNSSPSRITFVFNEFIEPVRTMQNIIISPTLSTIPDIDSRLRTLTLRLRDTLEPNTTYSINFGNSIKDVNEGNVLRDFRYVFSTGPTIDQNVLSGKVILARTGKVDSTLIAVLHRNLDDSAVIKNAPRYYARLDGSGNFRFEHLPAGKFAVFAMKDDPMRRYDDSTKLFAFLDSPVTVSTNTTPVTLYAYEQAKRSTTTTTTQSGAGNRSQDRRLRYSYNEGNNKDVLIPLQLDFSRKLTKFDSTKFILTDTSYNRLPGYSVSLDSNHTRVKVGHAWRPGTGYRLIIQKDAVADADGTTLSKQDTLSFVTMSEKDYGSVRVRFANLDLTRNPVLQLVQNDEVVDSVALTGREWRRELFKPGEYELRILFDANKNQTWDPGNFRLKKQPEVVMTLPRRLTIRANWDNEIDISL